MSANGEAGFAFTLRGTCWVRPRRADDRNNAQPARPTPRRTRSQLLLDLLRDPAVQQWLEQQPTDGATPSAERPHPPQAFDGGYFAQRLEYLRDNQRAWPPPGTSCRASWNTPGHPDALPPRPWLDRAPVADRDLRRVIPPPLGLLAAHHRFRNWLIGDGVASRRPAARDNGAPGVRDRLRSLLQVGGVGAFLCFAWPLLLREIVLAISWRSCVSGLARVVGGFLLRTGGGRRRIRIVPCPTRRDVWHDASSPPLPFSRSRRHPRTVEDAGVSPAGPQLSATSRSTACWDSRLETIIRVAPPANRWTARRRRPSRRGAVADHRIPIP